MRIVITGGTGLVGRALVGELQGAGHECTILSRQPERVTDPPPGAELRQWDAVSTPALRRLLEGAEAVVHLAGQSIASSRWTAAQKQRIRDSRVRSTRALAESLAELSTRPHVLLQGSAVGFYGPRGDEEVTETDPPGEDFLAAVCRQWESAGAGVEELGVRRVLLRTGVVLSNDGGALPRMALPFRMFAGGPLGSGSQWVPWIHISDEAGAIRYLLESQSARGVFNLTAPRPVSNRDLARALGRVLKRPSLMPAPGFALRLALGEMSTLLLTGQRAVPQRLLEAGYSFRFADIDSALQDLLGARG